MLSLRLDPKIERLLDHDVDDLARYNILRYLHEHPATAAGVQTFSDQLGLRSHQRVLEALDALVGCGLVARHPVSPGGEMLYGLSDDAESRDAVGQLYALRNSDEYGEIIERLAARSLHRARRALAASKNGRKNGHKHD